jgi:hypothetical protein
MKRIQIQFYMTKIPLLLLFLFIGIRIYWINHFLSTIFNSKNLLKTKNESKVSELI